MSLVAFLGLLVAPMSFAAAQPPVGVERAYIVTLSDRDANPGKVGKAQVERLDGRLGFVYRYGPIGYSAWLSDDAAAALARDPRVQSVVPDSPFELQAQTQSTGIVRDFASKNKALEIDEENNHWVNADVAVIDAGAYNEPDLNITQGVYCKTTGGVTACKEEAAPDSASGHGTGVAATLGAIDNTEGGVGVAPGVRIWPVKVTVNGTGTEAKVIAGINWVTENASKIEVANMSLGCEAGSCEAGGVESAISEAVVAGVVFVTAAGNFNIDVSKNGYAKNPYAITVSGIADYDGESGEKATSWWQPSCKATKQAGDWTKFGEDDHKYTESNWGEGIDIAAPAVCLETLNTGGGLKFRNGTSLAAPAVAGAAAILAEHENPENLEDVVAITNTILGAGNSNWKDTSGDGVKEPLLDLSNETIFY